METLIELIFWIVGGVGATAAAFGWWYKNKQLGEAVQRAHNERIRREEAEAAQEIVEKAHKRRTLYDEKWDQLERERERLLRAQKLNEKDKQALKDRLEDLEKKL